MKPNLILLDLDGVLIDSEIVWHKIHASYITQLGYPITEQQSKTLFTAHNQLTYDEIFAQQYGTVLSAKHKVAINEKTELVYSNELQPVANIADVLDYLMEKEVPFCVASNADRAYIASTLAITKLQNYFQPEQFFGTDHITKRKPAPDVFLKAAHYFNFDSQHCLVIEDHALGIQAAHKAHMPVLGFAGASHANSDQHRQWLSEAKPMAVINDALELLNWLKQQFD